jgi:DNA anti-recombination protein RmuC
VIAFLPGEALHSVALYEDQTLLDFCFEKNVILASPSTLYGFLKVYVLTCVYIFMTIALNVIIASPSPLYGLLKV